MNRPLQARPGSFGEALQEAMITAGFRQCDLAKASGYNEGQISNWMSGKHVPRDQAFADLVQTMALLPDEAADLRRARSRALLEARPAIVRKRRKVSERPIDPDKAARSFAELAQAATLLRLEIEAAIGRLDRLERQIGTLCARPLVSDPSA